MPNALRIPRPLSLIPASVSTFLDAYWLPLGVAAVVVSVLLIWLIWWALVVRRRLRWPLYARRVISAPELQLYQRLVRALPQQIVLAQVQVSRVLGVKPDYDFHEWNNRICRLSYDFVVCAPDGSVIAAVELDDSSHELEERMATDAKKDAATAAAGVPLIRWHVRAMPDVRAIQAAFKVLARVPRMP